MDFGFLPPEINSTRMYTGPGSGPLLAAAGSWDSLSAELSIAAAIYESVVSSLSGLHWRGPASEAMSTNAIRYVSWMHTTAEQAQQTAIQARAGAAAYDLAHAMTVPPAAVAANRAQLAVLIATNFFGQNTATIAATEAQYAEYWAQDAAAMYGYAANSAAATQLTPFSSPHQTTDPAGLIAQTAAVARADADAIATSPVSQELSAAIGLPPIIPTDLTILNVIQATGTTFSGIWKMEGTPTGIIGAEKDLGMLPAVEQAAPASGLAASRLGGGAGLGDVTATLARSGTLGSMSVPAGWTVPSDSPATALATGGSPTFAGTGAVAGSESAMPGLPGLPGGTSTRATGVIPRYGARLTVMSRPPAAG